VAFETWRFLDQKLEKWILNFGRLGNDARQLTWKLIDHSWTQCQLQRGTEVRGM